MRFSNKPYSFFIPLALIMLVFLTQNTKQKDNIVNIYTSRKEELLDQLCDLFTEKTKIKTNIIHDKPGKLIARMIAEGKNTSADVFITADVMNLSLAKQKKLLSQIDQITIPQSIPKYLKDKNNYWLPLTKRARIIIYSKDRVESKEIQNYEDLQDPKWGKKILISSSTSPYNQSLLASLIKNNGEGNALKWASAVKANFARRPRGGDTEQIKSVIAGEADIAIVNSYYFARLLEKNPDIQNKIGIIFPNQSSRGTHVNISGIGIAKYAKNKNNAYKLIEFMLTDEIQELYAKTNHEYPIIKGITLSETLTNMGNFKEDTTYLDNLINYNIKVNDIFDNIDWN